MEKEQKRKVIILTVVILLLIIMVIVVVMNQNNEANKAVTRIEIGNEIEENAQKNENNGEVEEFVKLLEDGTKYNTSNKIKETKKIEGMEITNLQVTEKDNVTLILGTVTNVSDTKQGDYPVKVKIIDKEGNQLITISAYIGPLKPGESQQFNTSATFDYANAYDFIITKDQ